MYFIFIRKNIYLTFVVNFFVILVLPLPRVLPQIVRQFYCHFPLTLRLLFGGRGKKLNLSKNIRQYYCFFLLFSIPLFLEVERKREVAITVLTTLYIILYKTCRFSTTK